MEQYYPTHLFIDVIEGQQGIHYQTTKTFEDVVVRFYVGLKGSIVMIDCSEEDLSFTVCKDYFIQLGLADLIPAIFPDPVETDVSVLTETTNADEEEKKSPG